MFVRKHRLILLLAVAIVVLPAASRHSQAARPVSQARDGGPLLLVENVGQFPSAVRFQMRGAAGPLWLTEDALWLTVAPAEEGGHGVALRFTFPGANPHPRLEPFARRETVFNYYLGDDPARWHVAVPTWGGVRYADLYPGVDLVIGWPWRLEVRRGADLSAVRLRVEGAEGVSVAEGMLHLSTAAGEVSLPLLSLVAPDGVAGASLRPAVGGYEVRAPFAPPSPHPASAPGDADGGLLYSTYLGGDADDCPFGGCGLAVDQDGNAYVTGMTESGDFPTTPGAFDTSYPVLGDAFVAKINADGSALVYATLLGGGKEDVGRAIAVDDAGCAYVTGSTASDNFPTTDGAFDEDYNAGYYPDDAFVVKLSADGSALVYATYLGGTANDRGTGLALDDDGNAYVTGLAQSGDFPTTPGAFDPTYNPSTQNGENDAFVTKLNGAGSGLVYSTYLGGGCDDSGAAIAVDGAGNAYVTGSTCSNDFPTTEGAFDRTLSGSNDAFVARLNAAGSALGYATYLGGDEYDSGAAIGIDGSGYAYVSGNTRSADFPVTSGAFDTTFGGGTCGASPCSDIFVAKLPPSGASLTYATFLGGGDVEYAGNSLAVDAEGRVYVTGGSESSDFPTTAYAFDKTFNGGVWDGVVVKLNAAGSGLDYATFLGGSGIDFGYALAIGATDRVYVAGHTRSSDFPTTAGALDITYNGDYDVFVTHLSTQPPAPDLSPSTKTVRPDEAVVGETVTFTVRLVNGGTLSASVSLSDTLPATLRLRGTPTASAGMPTVDGQTITWDGVVSAGLTVTLTYAAELTATATLTPTVYNEALIADGVGHTYLRRAFVNGYRVCLPLVLRGR